MRSNNTRCGIVFFCLPHGRWYHYTATDLKLSFVSKSSRFLTRQDQGKREIMEEKATSVSNLGVFSLLGFLELQSTYAEDHSEMEGVGRRGSLQEVSQYHQFSSFISLCVFLFMQKNPNKQILHGALDRLLWLNGACLVCHFSRKQK